MYKAAKTCWLTSASVHLLNVMFDKKALKWYLHKQQSIDSLLISALLSDSNIMPYTPPKTKA